VRLREADRGQQPLGPVCSVRKPGAQRGVADKALDGQEARGMTEAEKNGIVDLSFRGSRLHGITDAERFEQQVSPEPNTGCWLWLGGTTRRGYGRFTAHGDSDTYAHRYALACRTGEPGTGMCALHSCDQPSCVNPDHLRWGTQLDNMADMVRRGRAPTGARNGATKLADTQVAAFRAAVAGGMPVMDASRRFGISWSHGYRLMRSARREERS
jgi:hypothetical protein